MARALAVFFLLMLLASSLSMVFCKFLDEQGGELLKTIKKGTTHASGSLRSYQCPNACSRRCSRTQYHKPCMFFCQKCCRKCLCVPPGFYGNKQSCACYNNWKTKRGGPKCP